MRDGAHETCAECGFDASGWQVRDVGTLFEALGWWWDAATAGVDPSELNRRPAAGVWSVLEYGVHSALVTAVLRLAIDRILSEDGCRLPDPPQAEDATGSEPSHLDHGAVLADIEREAASLADLAGAAPSGAWGHVGHSGGMDLVAGPLLLHAAHDASHHQMDVARGFAALGAGTPAGTGRVVQLSASGGGVPKTAVSRAAVGRRGLEGDRQADRKHHGRPFQALCVWSAEVIEDLVSEGHPIGPGLAGENVTVSGVDWAGLRPGSLLEIGTVLAEVSFPATPCKKQARWFADGDFRRIDHDHNPGRARWYAWVRRSGVVATGDPLIVQPAPGSVASGG